MNPENTPAMPPTPFEVIERQQWLNIQEHADAIIEQMGSDCSTSERLAHDARWTSEQLNKDFLLVRQTKDSKQFYCLFITQSMSGEDYDHYTFYPPQQILGEVHSAEGHHLPDKSDDQRHWYLERLTEFLQSAPITRVKPEVNLSDEEKEVFSDIARHIVAEDDEVTVYFKSRYDRRQSLGKFSDYWSLLKYVQDIYGVDEDEARQAFDITQDQMRRGN